MDNFTREFTAIQGRLLTICGIIEQMIDDATRALCNHEVSRVVQVKERDKRVNAEEVSIEEECLKILALYQPVSRSLRQITAVLKINSDLERIADLAGNIAERADGLTRYPYFPVPDQLPVMAREATEMVRKSINAFVTQDIILAKEVILADVLVDQLNREIINELTGLMKTDSDAVDPALQYFSASRHYERIADHAENIAEDVVYMVSGEIIRHKHGKFGIEDKLSVTS